MVEKDGFATNFQLGFQTRFLRDHPPYTISSFTSIYHNLFKMFDGMDEIMKMLTIPLPFKTVNST